MEKWKLFTSLRYDPTLVDVTKKGFVNTGWNERSSPYYMLDCHRDRMLRAATYWDWQAAIDKISGEEGLKRLEDFLDTVTSQAGSVPHRIKITLSQDGEFAHEMGPTPAVGLNNLFPTALPEPGNETGGGQATDTLPSRHPEFEVLIDSQGTEKSAYTHYKTTNRAMYDGARSRARIGLPDQKEVLIFHDDNNSIMEGSITTPYFWRAGRWVTPPVPLRFDKTQGSGGNDGTTRRWALERNLVVEEPVPAKDLSDGEECWLSNGVRGFIFGRIKCKPSNPN